MEVQRVLQWTVNDIRTFLSQDVLVRDHLESLLNFAQTGRALLLLRQNENLLTQIGITHCQIRIKILLLLEQLAGKLTYNTYQLSIWSKQDVENFLRHVNHMEIFTVIIESGFNSARQLCEACFSPMLLVPKETNEEKVEALRAKFVQLFTPYLVPVLLTKPTPPVPSTSPIHSSHEVRTQLQQPTAQMQFLQCLQRMCSTQYFQPRPQALLQPQPEPRPQVLLQPQPQPQPQTLFQPQPQPRLQPQSQPQPQPQPQLQPPVQPKPQSSIPRTRIVTRLPTPKPKSDIQKPIRPTNISSFTSIPGFLHSKAPKPLHSASKPTECDIDALLHKWTRNGFVTGARSNIPKRIVDLTFDE